MKTKGYYYGMNTKCERCVTFSKKVRKSMKNNALVLAQSGGGMGFSNKKRLIKDI